MGTLVVAPNNLHNSNTPASEFLESVNQAIISSAVIADLIALILGSVLFLQIIKPIRQLKKAATAIASGDLEQRVVIRSRDELGELGLVHSIKWQKAWQMPKPNAATWWQMWRMNYAPLWRPYRVR